MVSAFSLEPGEVDIPSALQQGKADSSLWKGLESTWLEGLNVQRVGVADLNLLSGRPKLCLKKKLQLRTLEKIILVPNSILPKHSIA